MKALIFTIAISLAASMFSSAQNQPDTLLLEEVVALALENNYSIELADLERQKVIFQQKENKSKLLPEVQAYSTFSNYYAIPKIVIPGEIIGQQGTIAVEFGTRYDWNTGLIFSQLIYNQSYFTSLTLISEMIRLNELNVKLKKEEVVLQVSQLYCLCQTLNKQLMALDSTIANMQKLKSLVELQRSNGMARRADVERLEIDINKVKIEKQKLAEHYKEQLNLLRLLTGQSMDFQMLLSQNISIDEKEMATVVNTAYRRTELQIIDKQKETTGLQATIEKQSCLPALSAFGQHYYQGMRNKFDFFDGGNDRFYKSGIVGLQLSIPVFDGFARKNRIKKQEIELKKLQTLVSQTELLDDKERREAWQNYHNSQQELSILRENVKSAERNYQANLLAYQQQILGLTDLILSENQLTECVVSSHNAMFKVKSAELKLRKLYGTLLNK